MDVPHPEAPASEAAPWEVPPAWLVETERSNPAAQWALGLGIASVVPGVGLGAVAAGVIGVMRARATRGTGRTAAVVGLALGAAFLLLDLGGVGVGVFHAVSAGIATSVSAGSGDGGDDGGALPDPDDRTSSDLSDDEQAYIDVLDDVTYLNFDDETLLAMGRQACSDLADGLTPTENSDRLNDSFGSGAGDAWDVQWAATQTFCPESADLLTQPDGPTTT